MELRWSLLKTAATVGLGAGLTAAIYAGGGVETVNPDILYAAITLAAFWFGAPGGTAAGLAAGLAVGWWMPAQVEGAVAQPLSDWLPRLFIFGVVGGATGEVIWRLRRQAAGARQLLERWTAAREGEQRAVQELQALVAVDRSILAEAPTAEAMDLTVRLLTEVLRADYGAAFTLAGGTLEAAAACGTTVEELQAIPLRRGRPLRVGEGLVGWAVLQSVPALSEDVTKDPRYTSFPEGGKALGVRSAIAVPIMLGGRTYGALWVGFREPRRLGPEVATVSRMAAQLAVAIDSSSRTQQLRVLTFETVMAMADAIESRDPYTGGHSGRLIRLAGETAQALALPKPEIEVIRYGAALHDIGKIAISDAVLKKSGQLTPTEFAEMMQHCYVGSQICKRVSFLEAMAPIVYHHHERWDGAGYPDRLRGEQIPLGARIVAVADAWDAMTHDRPYRAALPLSRAAAELRGLAGQQWDPHIVELFLELRREAAAA